MPRERERVGFSKWINQKAIILESLWAPIPGPSSQYLLSHIFIFSFFMYVFLWSKRYICSYNAKSLLNSSPLFTLFGQNFCTFIPWEECGSRNQEKKKKERESMSLRMTKLKYKQTNRQFQMLRSMWRNWNCHGLLVEMQNGTNILEKVC